MLLQRYKGYKIVNGKGLQRLLKSAVIENDLDFKNYLKTNNILFVGSHKDLENGSFTINYEDFIIKNNKNNHKRKIEKVYIVCVYKSVCFVENIRENKVVRKELLDIISEVKNGKLYITNIEELKDLNGFI